MIRGIDLSHFNDGVNIATLPKDIAFVSLKATQGTTMHDALFQKFYHDLKTFRPEIVRIPYHFIDWAVDGVTQAKNILSRGIDFTGTGCGPIMIDLEGDGDKGVYVSKNKVACIQRVNDCIAYMRANCGRHEIIIYSYNNFIKNNLGGHIWPDCIYWVASYQTNPPPVNSAWPYKFWQYSQFGQINGSVSGGNQDLDRFFGTQQELNKLANIV